MSEAQIVYVQCARGGCHFYKRADAATLCRCAALEMNKLTEDMSVRLLNNMAEQLSPERIAEAGLTSSEAA